MSKSASRIRIPGIDSERMVINSTDYDACVRYFRNYIFHKEKVEEQRKRIEKQRDDFIELQKREAALKIQCDMLHEKNNALQKMIDATKVDEKAVDTTQVQAALDEANKCIENYELIMINMAKELVVKSGKLQRIYEEAL